MDSASWDQTDDEVVYVMFPTSYSDTNMLVLFFKVP